MTRTPKKAKQALAIALVLPFLLGVLASDASHCRSACDDCPEAALADSSRILVHLCFFDHPHDRPHVEAGADDHASDVETCLGATCLCHQTPHLSGGASQLVEPPFELDVSIAPQIADQGVTDEILHIPKTIA